MCNLSQRIEVCEKNAHTLVFLIIWKFFGDTHNEII